MSVIRRLRRVVDETASALPLAREATATVARRQYDVRVQRFLVERSGLAAQRPDALVFVADHTRDAGSAAKADAAGALDTVPMAIPRVSRATALMTDCGFLAEPAALAILTALDRQGYRRAALVTDGAGVTDTVVTMLEHLAERGTLAHVRIPADAWSADASAGLTSLRAAAQRPNAALRVGLDVRLDASSVERLASLADEAAHERLASIRVTHTPFTTSDDVADTVRALDISAADVALPVVRHPGLTAVQVQASIKELDRTCRRRRLPLDVRPRVDAQLLDDYYAPGASLPGRCLFPFLHATVTTRGAVLFCPTIQTTLGHVADAPLETIWNAPRYRAMRCRLLESGMFPLCRRCPHVEVRGDRHPNPRRLFAPSIPVVTEHA